MWFHFSAKVRPTRLNRSCGVASFTNVLLLLVVHTGAIAIKLGTRVARMRVLLFLFVGAFVAAYS